MENNSDNQARKRVRPRWVRFVIDVFNATVRPLASPPALIYFIVAIGIVSLFGVWVAIFKTPDDPVAIREAFVTFLPTFIAANLFQVVMTERPGDGESLKIFSILVVGIICFLGVIIYTAKAVDSLIYCWWATGLALWIWWLGNASQFDSGGVDPIDPMGGKLKDVKDMPGNDKGFQF